MTDILKGFSLFCGELSDTLYLFRSGIAELAPGLLSILDGLLRAEVDAAHAVGTVLAPYRAPILELDICQRTDRRTASAADTGLCGVKSIRFHEIFVIHSQDHLRGEILPGLHLRGRQLGSGLYAAGNALNGRLGLTDFL